MRTTQCSICAHPRRQAAEALMKNGVSTRKAAKQLNINHSSLQRHRNGCMTRPREEPHVASLRDPKAELVRLHSSTMEIFERAKKAEDVQAMWQALTQARLNIHLAARMAGVFTFKGAGETASVTLQQLTTILSVRRDLSAGR